MVAHNKIRERTEFVIRHKETGLTFGCILEMVNVKAEEKGWGKVTIGTLRNNVTRYYRENALPTYGETPDEEAMRQELIAQMEKTIEALAIRIKTKPDEIWKPFEKERAIVQLFQMQKELLRIQGWDRSRKSSLLTMNVQHTEFQALIEGGEMLKQLEPEKKAVLLQQLDELILNTKQQEEERMIKEDKRNT